MKTGTEQTATYCPEDDKLRLYVGRVPREEYLQLRKEGWTCLHKQRESGGGDFAAVWTPSREDTALKYSEGIIEDEDMGPQERAADRAERFSGYRDKREGEATDLADTYDAGPMVHGYQSAALAERRASKQDAIATRAVNVWEKAEYWQRRTAGVISHALHVSAPGVRMGRIKTIEAELRKYEACAESHSKAWAAWSKIAGLPEDQAYSMAVHLANTSGEWGDYKHPRSECVSEYIREHGTSLWSLLTNEGGKITGHEAAELWLTSHKPPEDHGGRVNRWVNHLRLRLAYENQMIEAQGGRLASVDMEPGGWIGKQQVYTVHKSPVTGRVTSVKVKVPRVSGWNYRTANVPGTDYALLTIETERLPPNAYRAPTDEERAELEANKKAAKKARGVVPIINPTRTDAERLQAKLNAEAEVSNKARNYPLKPGVVEENTQAQYSASFKDYRSVREIAGACKVRVRVHGWSSVVSVVVLTDKPQKPLPETVWQGLPQQTEAQRVTA